MIEEIHENDAGTLFTVPLSDAGQAVDLSAAITKEIIFLKPTGETLVKDAEFVTDGSDSLLKYISVLGDLVPSGAWRIQAHVALPSGEWHSNVRDFTVYRNLPKSTA
jgi:hypothetical protein